MYRVTAYKLDGITEIYTCVNLDWESGEFIEFYHDWPGFEQVVSEITAKLAGIDTNWFQKVQQSSISDPPAEVWCRLDLTL